MGSWKMSDISSKEMEMELKRRNLLFDPKEEKVVPLQIEDPDFTGVRDLCQKYVASIAAQDWADEDEYEGFEGWIFQSTMRSVFGPQIFEWISENSNG